MDDNPWGAPSAPSSPHLDPTSHSLQLEQEPRLSVDIDDDDDLAPTWGQDSPGDAVAARLPPAAPVTDDKGEGALAGEPEQGEGTARTSFDEPADGVQQAPAPVKPTSPTSPPPPPPPAHADSPEPASPPPNPPSPPAPPTSLPTLSFDDSLLDEGPPMDDFSDVDDEPVLASVGADGDDDGFGAPADDFDDFGSVGEAGDDDFGDFGDAAPLDEAAFDAPAPVAPPPAPTAAPAPVSYSAYPPLRLDLSDTSRRAVAPQLRDFFAEAWPASLQAVNDDPERQVEGPAQVLVTESSRNLFTTLSTVPPLKPLDWRRSRIRREHLISMGIPVNLDESTEPKISALSLSASLHVPSRPSSAPPLAGSPLPFRSSSPSSTPYGAMRASASRSRTAQHSPVPTFDRARATELLALAEDDLTLLGLERLRAVSDELEKISVDASGALTHALMTREKEGQDKEVYNGMIQDLVVAAAKIKTSSPSLGKAPQRQGSGRWKLTGSVK
ncbi:uncharacterized protein RHOBADRAFT_51720 [Rhodotorula graminis WP1]|uniref:Uncharacterized protein n=1 Tax=Rhodotorula graminis (strain WP1) TaxID=578459 RepID=A0A194S829_RHOGW|nr:uncharacterized protein RHOBADRAFT_51720 [Rhodotorula graminis WP1]KPV76719.1 hypothetical protein RHOBADRAFT_51720 [Rhodotorula graminis WP1]